MPSTGAIQFICGLLVLIIPVSPLLIKGCTLLEFRCKSGQCIGINQRCDGQVNCYDGSDETPEICKPSTTRRLNNENNSPPQRTQRPLVSPGEKGITPEITKRFGCELGEFTCLNGECIGQNYVCDKRRDCSDGSDEASSICAINTSATSSNEFDINFGSKLISCELPPQPANGYWQLHKSLCTSSRNCDPPENLREMQAGSHLVYRCNSNYNLKGSSDVLCGPGGKWVKIPACEKIHCSGLSDAAREAYCALDNEKVICNVPVPARTEAKLACRGGFVEEALHYTTSRNVTCRADGKWSPEPIVCSKYTRQSGLL